MILGRRSEDKNPPAPPPARAEKMRKQFENY